MTWHIISLLNDKLFMRATSLQPSRTKTSSVFNFLEVSKLQITSCTISTQRIQSCVGLPSFPEHSSSQDTATTTKSLHFQLDAWLFVLTAPTLLLESDSYSSLGCPQAYYVAEVDLTLLIFLYLVSDGNILHHS